MSLTLGTVVGAYRITGYLGEGAITKVFKAYQVALDRFVLLKVLQPRGEVSLYERFQREAQLTARLDHPNLLPALDFRDDPSTVSYTVYKWVDGETLKNRLRLGALPMAEAARVVGAVSAALTYLHRQSVIHRDLRPSNVILGRDGNVYVTDLAVPPATQGGTALLDMNDPATVGAPEYASPELLRGEPLEPASDQYALAVIVYEMLTGSVPFWADNPEDLIHHHLTNQATRPSVINPSLPSGVDEVVLRALQKRPEQRYADVAGFMQAFQRAVAPPRPRTAPLEETGGFTAAINELAYASRTIALHLQNADTTLNLTGRARYWLGRSEPARDFRPEVDLAEHQGLELGVSRKHGTLHFDQGRLYYTDQRSANGSRLNGARLYTEIPVELKDGDEICLGKLVMRIYLGK